VQIVGECSGDGALIKIINADESALPFAFDKRTNKLLSCVRDNRTHEKTTSQLRFLAGVIK
jgi:hypothetical protein